MSDRYIEVGGKRIKLDRHPSLYDEMGRPLHALAARPLAVVRAIASMWVTGAAMILWWAELAWEALWTDR